MERWVQVLIGAVLAIAAGCVVGWKWDEIDWGSVPAYLAAIGFVIAARGLDTWRRQMRGAHDFELARRTLKATFQLRDAVQAVRNPFLDSEEGAGRPVDSEQPWEAFAYQNRWNPVSEADQDLSVALLEIEVVWGHLIKTECEALRAHIHVLNLVVRKLLRNRDPKRRTPLQPAERLTPEQDGILYRLGDDDDGYTTRLHELVRDIEIKVAPKLGR